jgi:hypothetical protein
MSPSPVTCAAFERWLDEGSPDDRAAAMDAHARTCDRCARSARAAAAIDHAFASSVMSATARASEGLTDRVMARIDRVEDLRRTHAPLVAAPALPWWLDALAQPVTALVALLCGLVVWRYETLLGGFAVTAKLLSLATPPLVSGLARAEAWLLPPGTADPYTVTAVGVAILAAAAVPSLALARWTGRLASR